MILAGQEYVTGTEIADRWGDVGPDRLRDWVRTGRIRPLTVGRLAELTGLPVPDGADPDALARLPTRHGPQNLYPWDAVVEIEAATRTSGRGARRSPGPG